MIDLSSFNHLLQAIPSSSIIFMYTYQLINLIFFDSSNDLIIHVFVCVLLLLEQFPVVLCSPSEIEKMKFQKSAFNFQGKKLLVFICSKQTRNN